MNADVLHAMHCRVVRKPFDLQDLLDAIAAALGPSPVQWDRGEIPHATPSANDIGAGPARLPP